MAEKVISQGEMDALMKGGVGKGLSGIQSYDLTSQKRVIPARILTLEMISEQFARYFQSALGTLLAKELEFKLQPTETVECGELINKIPMLSSVNVIGMEPLKGNALILVESDTVYLLLDHFFGGSGRIHAKAEGEFTPVEQRFVQKVVGLMLTQLQKAWHPVYPVHLTLVRSETNPKFAMIVPPKEVMIVVPFNLKIGNDERRFSICLPYPTVEPIWEKLCALYQGQATDTVDEWHEALRQHMGGCKAEVKADLGVASLRVSEITALKPGDVVLLDKVQSDELELTVEGIVKFSGRPGTHRGNVSFQVSSVVK
jgi:flagellar motor switch protein FliM